MVAAGVATIKQLACLAKDAEELRAAYEVRKYCLDYEENHPGETLKMKPRCCSRWFFWLCCCDEKVSLSII